MTSTNEPTVRVLVTGSTGKTGRRLVDVLSRQGAAVRAASRSAVDPAARFDWDEPRTWDAALAGVDAVYLTFQPDLAAPGAPKRIGAFAERIAAAGIRRAVLVSGRGEPAAHDCERALGAAVPTATVLSCSWFDQNFTEGALSDAVLAGVVSLPAPVERTEPFLDVDDIAACAAVALIEPTHEGQTYELTGPESLALAEIASLLSRFVGRRVEYIAATEAEFAGELARDGVLLEYAAALAATFAEVLDGRNSATTDGVERLLGRPGRSFEEFARAAALAGAWGSKVEASA